MKKNPNYEPYNNKKKPYYTEKEFEKMMRETKVERAFPLNDPIVVDDSSDDEPFRISTSEFIKNRKNLNVNNNSDNGLLKPPIPIKEAETNQPNYPPKKEMSIAEYFEINNNLLHLPNSITFLKINQSIDVNKNINDNIDTIVKNKPYVEYEKFKARKDKNNVNYVDAWDDQIVVDDSSFDEPIPTTKTY
jgi:hypothetical protein